MAKQTKKKDNIIDETVAAEIVLDETVNESEVIDEVVVESPVKQETKQITGNTQQEIQLAIRKLLV